MRDQLKDIKYFNKYIKTEEKSIFSLESKLKLNKVPHERIHIVKKTIAYSCQNKLIAKYSSGESIDSLKGDLLKSIQLMNESWINNEGKVYLNDKYVDQYLVHTHQELLQTLCLAYLLNISDSYFKMLIDIIDRDNISDNLYEFIIKSRFPDRKQNRPEEYDLEHSIILKVYDKLRKATVTENKEEASKLVKQFLEKDFYHKHSNFYEFHKKRQDAYYGYWSFEAAAIVKIMGLDDSSFIDNQYYPKDLVHQALETSNKKGFLTRLGLKK